MSNPTSATTRTNTTLRRSGAAEAGAQDLLRLVAGAENEPERLAIDLGRAWGSSSTSSLAADLQGVLDLAADRAPEAEVLAVALLGRAPAGHRLLAGVRPFASTARLRESESAPDDWCKVCKELGGRSARGQELADVLRGRCDRLLAELLRGKPLAKKERSTLVALLNLEIEARDERIRALACRLMDHRSEQAPARLKALAGHDNRTDDLRLLVSQLAAEGGRQELVAPHSRFLLALGKDGRRKIEAVLAARPELERLAMVWRGVVDEGSSLPDPAAGLVRLLAVSRVQGEVPLLPPDPDPLALAALVVGRGHEGQVKLPLPPAAVAALDGDARAVALPEGVTRAGGELVVRCDDAVRTIAIGPTPDAPAAEDAMDGGAAAIKRLVLNSMQSTSALSAYLRDQKVTSIPGLVEEIVVRTRNPQIVETIATQRTLHGGFANRGVPLALLKSPVNVSPKTLRKFAHVKYVSKIDLKRLANDKAGVRKEVLREIEKYLSSLT